MITEWPNLFDGFVIRMSEAQAVAISKHTWVKSVEEDGLVSLATTQTLPSGPIAPGTPATMWGLDRIDQASIGAPRTNGAYSYCSTGAGFESTL